MVTGVAPRSELSRRLLVGLFGWFAFYAVSQSDWSGCEVECLHDSYVSVNPVELLYVHMAVGAVIKMYMCTSNEVSHKVTSRTQKSFEDD